MLSFRLSNVDAPSVQVHALCSFSSLFAAEEREREGEEIGHRRYSRFFRTRFVLPFARTVQISSAREEEAQGKEVESECGASSLLCIS